MGPGCNEAGPGSFQSSRGVSEVFRKQPSGKGTLRDALPRESAYWVWCWGGVGVT